MVVIARGSIIEFIGRYPVSSNVLNEWYIKTKKAAWNSFGDVRLTFNSCDSIGNDRYVFNVGGNNYRLIAMIHFKRRTLYIRGIFTHPEYDEANKRGILQTL